MVGHVVAVGEEHPPHAPQLLQPAQQRPRGAGRVHEDVALRAANEVARGAERALGREAAEVDLRRVVEPLREGGHARGRIAPRIRADGARRARHEGHQRAGPLGLRFGLAMDDGKTAPAAAEVTGGDDAARAAVDAGGVDEERSRRVLAQPLRGPGHVPIVPRAVGNPTSSALTPYRHSSASLALSPRRRIPSCPACTPAGPAARRTRADPSGPRIPSPLPAARSGSLGTGAGPSAR